MLSHTSVHPFDPQLPKIPFLDLPITVRVLHPFLYAANSSFEGAVGTAAESLRLLDDGLVFLGCHGPSASACGGEWFVLGIEVIR